ncbi:SRPBCC family protein [Gordonia sp. Z-3]|jgi:uncharacterized protein YndB with AHSA1/START domain|uniref:SRPBCC family protein n=1 Tax=unclassified Gordonia (in: high G+C Gram-positive bacteria) TaxID=2657482 RepID=UPI002E282DDF|nr:SRPBCC family protein [Gordonia sp. Z-3]MED5799671.1 SRPBCC family protein [Gordonia sp. Z-3]
MTLIPSGRRRLRPEGDAVEFTRTYRTPISDVWAAVTESDRLARWIGFYTGDPTQGYVQFTMNAEGEDNMIPVRYDIRRCEPPRVLQIRATDDFGTWDLVVEMVEADGITTVTLAEMVNDPTAIENTGPGWEYYLDRLTAVMLETDPAAVDFDDYYPAQREYYRLIQQAIVDDATSAN